jgi:nicotinate phosphoribosyltransferase
VLDEGKVVYDLPSLEEIRRARLEDVRCLDPGVRRLMNPHIYHVSLTPKLWELKQQLIRSAMEKSH